MNARKFVYIVVREVWGEPFVAAAVADDGTAWERAYPTVGWKQVPPLPDAPGVSV